MNLSRLFALTGIIASAALLAACGGDSSSSSGAKSAGHSSAADEFARFVGTYDGAISVTLCGSGGCISDNIPAAYVLHPNGSNTTLGIDNSCKVSQQNARLTESNTFSGSSSDTCYIPELGGTCSPGGKNSDSFSGNGVSQPGPCTTTVLAARYAERTLTPLANSVGTANNKEA